MDSHEKLEEIKQNPQRYLKSIAMDLVVVIVAVAYIFYNMVKLEPQNLNPLVLLAVLHVMRPLSLRSLTAEEAAGPTSQE